MNGISWTRKLFWDVHWLVLNGNWIVILDTKGDIYKFQLSSLISSVGWFGFIEATSSSSSSSIMHSFAHSYLDNTLKSGLSADSQLPGTVQTCFDGAEMSSIRTVSIRSNSIQSNVFWRPQVVLYARIVHRLRSHTNWYTSGTNCFGPKCLYTRRTVCLIWDGHG